MVHSHITVLFVAPLQKRELGYPEEIEFIVVNHIKLLSHFDTKRTQYAEYNLILVRRK